MTTFSAQKSQTEIGTKLIASQLREQALAKVLATMPEEGRILQAMVQKDISILGDGESFAMTDPSGQLKAFRGKMLFSVLDGTLYDARKFKMISEKAYIELERSVGGWHHLPPQISVNGQTHDNPHRVIDKTGELLGIYYLVWAAYLAPNGIPRRIAWTFYYDVQAIRRIELFAKAKEFPQAFRLRSVSKPEPEEKGEWIPYHVDGTARLWVDGSHPEALQFFASMANSAKNIESIGQTKAIRTALDKLYAVRIPIIKFTEKGYPVHASQFTIPITMWKWPRGLEIDWMGTAQHFQETIMQDDVPLITGETISSSDEESLIPEIIDEGDSEFVEVDFIEPEQSAENQQVNSVVSETTMTATEALERKQKYPMLKLEPEKEEPSKMILNYREILEIFPDESQRAILTYSSHPDFRDFRKENPTEKQAKMIYDKVDSFMRLDSGK